MEEFDKIKYINVKKVNKMKSLELIEKYKEYGFLNGIDNQQDLFNLAHLYNDSTILFNEIINTKKNEQIITLFFPLLRRIYLKKGLSTVLDIRKLFNDYKNFISNISDEIKGLPGSEFETMDLFIENYI